jgi:hypothetical protein
MAQYSMFLEAVKHNLGSWPAPSFFRPPTHLGIGFHLPFVAAGSNIVYMQLLFFRGASQGRRIANQEPWEPCWY